MFNSTRSEKIIGANFSHSLEVDYKGDSGIVDVELLINPRGVLVDFSVCGVEKVRDLFISLLEDLIKKNFEKSASPSQIYKLSEDQILKTYWWQLLDEVHFFFSPVLDSIVSKRDELICRCFAVTKSEILNVIEDGATDVLTVTNLTKAAGGCGNCVSDIADLLENPRALKKVDSEDSKSVYKCKYPREKIEGMWPASYLQQVLIPFLEELNSRNSQGWSVKALVEDHLYISNVGDQNSSEELENFLKQRSTGLKVFYS